ncbi:hypothetical protein [Donghicola tyrosinivorans]|uniref:Glycerophosphoryl diester phosphodiesterase membrane domain-containing protein n=1 Tax=Donghicola tyrosinivorans TaxID=1652492 RepID=A0A2T0WY51_9RHOB|nr:hypothetical protein [Donghicola tyrosinivorans]PRY91626.1 hypothetical protein CLV74_103211 [Donghicola tyrosinivorans]
MTGWMLFKHAVAMVLRNWREALRISGLLYLVLAVVELSFGQSMQGGGHGGNMPMSGGAILIQLLVAVLYVILSLWIAVSWHRYILLEEMPEGYVPQWHGRPIMRYLGFSLLITLIVALAAALGATALMIVGKGLAPVAVALGVFLVLYLFTVFYRLSPMLPAAAIGEDMGLKEAWDKTKGLTGAILLIIALQMALTFGLQLFALGFAGIPIIGIIAQIAANWFLTMVMASLLTTFYGHFVQERALL